MNDRQRTNAQTQHSRILAQTTTDVSPWVRFVSKTVADLDGRAVGDFHSLDIADYVSILALTTDGMIPLVRQFRPAVERETLEFPGGLLDPGETPRTCAMRELAEEAGLSVADAVSIGTTLPDSGRLGNRMWCFFARDAQPIERWVPESDVQSLMVSPDELANLVRSGAFDHAPHLALYALARVRGYV